MLNVKHHLKIDVFEIPDNENIGKLFSKYELPFLDQANSSCYPSQILILRFPIPRASQPLSLSPTISPLPPSSNFTLGNWNTLQHNPHNVLHSVSLFCPPLFATMSCRYHVLPMSYPTRYHKYWIYQTIRQFKPIRFIVKLHPDHNTLWVKHATHQIVKFLRPASLSKWDNTVNSNSIFNTKHVEFFTKW